MVTKHRLDEQTEMPTTPQPSIGALFTSAFEDVGTLVQHEISLAKQELKVSFKRGWLGIAFLAFAGLLLLLSVIIGSVAAAYGIHSLGLQLGWSYLIVAGAYLGLAIVIAIVAILLIKKVRGPEHAIEQAKATKAALLDR